MPHGAEHDRMSIGDFARASGLTPKALRLYDELGLLPPAAVDPVTGYRGYDADQLDVARWVARLRGVGMPLARIRAVLDLSGQGRAVELLSYRRQLDADHATVRARLAVLVDDARSAGRAKETTMTTTHSPVVATRHGIGGRDLDLDAVGISPRVLAVADGLGTDPTLAAGVVERLLATAGSSWAEGSEIAVLDDAVSRAAEPVLGGPDDGSACTLTAVLVGDGRIAVAHVGDSRLWLVREGTVQRLTRDHSLVQSLVDEGRLTPEEARLSDDRVVINRAIGPGTPYAPDLAVVPTRPGDRLVLTTDGVHAVLAGDVLADLLVADAEPEAVAAAVEAAVVEAGAPDNYAVVVADLT